MLATLGCIGLNGGMSVRCNLPPAAQCSSVPATTGRELLHCEAYLSYLSGTWQLQGRLY
jgi:hypothetical protein